MPKLYFIDFDRTAFDNHQFFQDFSTVLASYFHIDGNELHAIAAEHNKVRAKATGIFSAFAMVREHYPDIDMDNVKRFAAQELGERTYLYADVHHLLDYLEKKGDEVRIITVGTEEYQRFKFIFTPRLHDYPYIITHNTKGHCLLKYQAEFANFEAVILVDDRADTFDEDFRALGIKGIRLNRVDSAYGYEPTPVDIQEITTLIELIDEN